DVHCHLNLHAFDEDWEEVARRAFDSGVTKIINAGTSIPSSRRAVELAQEYDNMFAIVGVHPHHADKSDIEFEGEIQIDWLQELEKLASNPKVVGIGEIGLDYYSYKSNGIVDKKVQEEAFVSQIELAHKLKLPLQIHNRHAGMDIIRILEKHKSELLEVPGMFHCMSGDLGFLEKVLELGFYAGFDGNITYKGIAPGETIELSELVKHTPLDRIVTETDSPFLTPVPKRGSRNEPAHVIIVGKFISQLKNIPFETVEAQTTANAIKIFNLGL
ncbi:MAG: TatD family hydrolase, partial [Candidatus Levyibacteriota bacterium]